MEADFHIGFSLQLYSHPTNSLADGSCCEKSCTSCNAILYFCFRDSQHSHEDTNRDTCFLFKERDTTSVFTFLADLTSSVNANFTVSHDQRTILILSLMLCFRDRSSSLSMWSMWEISVLMRASLIMSSWSSPIW